MTSRIQLSRFALVPLVVIHGLSAAPASLSCEVDCGPLTESTPTRAAKDASSGQLPDKVAQ